MSDEYGPFPSVVWEEICQYLGNHKCCDCPSLDTDWASVSHGTLICLDCAGKHRSLGVRVSFVRSIRMDTWNKEQIEMMRQGGNAQIRDFFAKINEESNSIIQLYNSKGASHYRASLKDRVSKILSGEISANRKVHKPTNTSEEMQARDQHAFNIVFPAGSLGITLSQDVMGAATIKKILPGSAAETLGVMIDDKIVAVGGQLTPNFDDALQSLARGPRPLQVTLSRVISNGKPPLQISPRHHSQHHISPRTTSGSNSSTPKHLPQSTPRSSARPSPRASPRTSPKSSPTATSKKCRSPNQSTTHSNSGSPEDVVLQCDEEVGNAWRTQRRSSHGDISSPTLKNTESKLCEQDDLLMTSNERERVKHSNRKFSFSDPHQAAEEHFSYNSHHLETIMENDLLERVDEANDGMPNTAENSCISQVSDNSVYSELFIKITPSMDECNWENNEALETIVSTNHNISLTPSERLASNWHGLPAVGTCSSQSIDEVDSSGCTHPDFDSRIVDAEQHRWLQLHELVASGFAELIKVGRINLGYFSITHVYFSVSHFFISYLYLSLIHID